MAALATTVQLIPEISGGFNQLLHDNGGKLPDHSITANDVDTWINSRPRGDGWYTTMGKGSSGTATMIVPQQTITLPNRGAS